MYFVKSEQQQQDSHVDYFLNKEEGYLKHFYCPSCGKSYMFGKCPECHRERSADNSDLLI